MEIPGPTKKVSLRVILTVVTGRLLTARKGPRNNGIRDLYELLGYMTDDQPFSHQLGRFIDECKPWLLRWHPQLSAVEQRLPELDRLLKGEADNGSELWIAECERDLGRELPVGKIPRDDHEQKHPYDELVQMRGTDEDIVIL